MDNNSFFAILIGGLLVNNFVLSQFLGICPFLGVSKKLNGAVGMSLAVIFVMLMSTAATWPIYTYLLVPHELEYLQTIVFILIIAALVLSVIATVYLTFLARNLWQLWLLAIPSLLLVFLGARIYRSAHKR